MRPLEAGRSVNGHPPRTRGIEPGRHASRIGMLLMVLLIGGTSLLLSVHRGQVEQVNLTRRVIRGLDCVDRSVSAATAAAALLRPLTRSEQRTGAARVDAELALLAAAPTCHEVGVSRLVAELREDWTTTDDSLPARASRLLHSVAALTTEVGNRSDAVLDPVASEYHKADMIITVLPALRAAVAETTQMLPTRGARPSERSPAVVATAARVELLTDQLELRAGHLFAVDPRSRAKLAPHVTKIVRWAERITPGHVLSAPLPDAEVAVEAGEHAAQVEAISSYVSEALRRSLAARLVAQTRRSRVSLSLAALLGCVGMWRAAVGVRDARRRRRSEEDLHHRAFHDPLTGLANRDWFRQQLAAALALPASAAASTAVVLVDLNDFKALNDGFGHHVGDGVLVEMAARLNEGARGGDVVARLGGDEFALLLKDVDRGGAEALCDRLATLIAVPCDVHGHEIVVHASLGIYLAEAGVDLDQAMRNADIAMYEGKLNRVETAPIVFDTQRHAGALERDGLGSDLRGVAQRGELVSHYQPIFDLSTRRIIGAEALVRWQHPSRGLLMPEQFIPLAEAGTSILEIGEWILQAAFQEAVVWREEFGSAFQISVNVAVRQLMDSGASGRIHAILAQNALSPTGVWLEVTEEAFTSSSGQPTRQLHLLRDLGFSVAVDDFGTGYSSLGRLPSLPIDLLKIDRRFVAGSIMNSHDSTVADSVIGLARSLGKQALAEGIETKEQLRHLHAMGCDLGQGYLLADPMTSQELTRFMQDAASGSRGEMLTT